VSLVVASLTVLGLHALAFADTNDSFDTTAQFTKRPYVGVGIGVSALTPEDECPCLGVSDDKSTGFSLTLGYDVNRWLSAEVYLASLGSSEIEFLGADVGPVDYSVAGVSAIGYLFNSRSGWLLNDSANGLQRREGLSLYGRLGLGAIHTDTDLDYDRDYPVHMAVGVGAEYGLKNGLAMRAEFTAYDADAQFASISLLKRFGKVAEFVSVAVPVAAVATPSAKPAIVPAETREYVAAAPPFIYFGFDQEDLSPTAQTQLSAYADTIAQSDYSIVIEGHADWIGGEAYNRRLSERRANAVYEFLVAQGIDASRLTSVGYGEDRPNSSNHTAAGRSQNRRVEFFIN
jgi:OOP family OmpA-OmpF porin